MEQIGNALTCVAHFTSAGVGAVALTVTCDVYKIVNASTVTNPVSGAATVHVGKGAYAYTLASGSVDVEALYLFIFTKTVGVADQTDVTQGWIVGKGGVEYLDASILSTVKKGYVS